MHDSRLAWPTTASPARIERPPRQGLPELKGYPVRSVRGGVPGGGALDRRPCRPPRRELPGRIDPPQYDLLLCHRIHIVGEVQLHVRFCFTLDVRWCKIESRPPQHPPLLRLRQPPPLPMASSQMSILLSEGDIDGIEGCPRPKDHSSAGRNAHLDMTKKKVLLSKLPLQPL